MDSKKSFVLTGTVQRSTCNCGCVSSTYFSQDDGLSGTCHLASLHSSINKYLDELSGAGPGGSGKACDVKVTVTIEELSAVDHAILTRNSFSGLGYDDNNRLREMILTPTPAEDVVELKGVDESPLSPDMYKDISLSQSYVQDIHDRLTLFLRTRDDSLLESLQDSLKQLFLYPVQ